MSKQLLMIVLAAAAAAACGGKSKPAAGPGGGAGGGDGGPDRAALQAKLAATPQNDACSGDGATLGDLYAAQKAALVGDDNSPVDESFECRAGADEGTWDCTWSVFNKPGEPDPDDPCSGGSSSGYQIMVQVDASGAFVDGSIACIAPG